jgi:putative oxidoreductase
MAKSVCCKTSRGCSAILLIARLLLGAGCLLWTGLAFLFNRTGIENSLDQYGLHLDSPVLWIGSLILVIGGALILLGYRIRLTCAVLFCVTLPFLFFRLGFWGLSGFQAYVAETFFMSTAALLGGFILFMLTGAGNYAVRSRESHWGAAHEFRDWGLLLARLLIGGCLFIWDAVWRAIDWGMNLQILEASHIPMPHFILGCMVAIEFIGGVMILLGWRQRLAAWVLAIYWALTLLATHRFWVVGPSETPALDHLLQMKYFMDGLGVIAALLLLTTCISDRFGFERKEIK